MRLDRLPAFGLDEYAALLAALAGAGYRFWPVSRMREAVRGPTVYLRHDIDLHLVRVDEMAEVEARHGVSASYYVLPNGPYNPFFAPNLRVVRRLVELGHEVGVHYDLSTYPGTVPEMAARLGEEAGRIAAAAGAPVRTVCTHVPHLGLPDPFLAGDEFVHPHDPRHQDGLLYVSDSCRAWRDESLLSCFGAGRPERLLLNTHPELWLDGAEVDRGAYTRGALWENGSRPYREYLGEVRHIWSHHPAAAVHEARERSRPEGPMPEPAPELPFAQPPGYEQAMMNGATLCGERVCLGPLADPDSEVLFRWINDREQVLFNSGYRPVSPAQHRAWFEAVQSRDDTVLFAIRRRADGVLVGSCQLHSIHPVHRSAELQIRLGEVAARGQGLGQEAVRLLLRFAFADLNLERVYLNVLADNARAIHVYEKAGFVREGVARRAAYVDGRHVDTIQMGVLRDEFAW